MRFQKLASIMSRGTSRIAAAGHECSFSRPSSLIGAQHAVAPVGACRGVQLAPRFAWQEKRPLGAAALDEFEKRIGRIMKLANEAQLCIQDCGESRATEHFDEDLRSARIAVDKAGVAYSELLEELALTDEGVALLNEVRKDYAPTVESLRHELKKISV